MQIHKTPLEKAINAVGGNKATLARLVGVTPQAIQKIQKNGGILPIRNIPPSKWESVTGLPKKELFPQFFD